MNQVSDFGKTVEQIIITHLNDDGFGIKKLCEKLGLSRMQVHRKIKHSRNVSTSIFIRNIRLEKSRHLLIETQKTIKDIAFEVGFDTSAYYCRCFKIRYGLRPGELRREAVRGND